MSNVSTVQNSNMLLAALSTPDLALMQPYLTPVKLALLQKLRSTQ